MKTNRFYLIAALAGTLLAGCQTELSITNPEEQTAEEPTWTLTIQASKGVNTRAMELNDKNAATTYWKKGEKVGVFFGETRLGYLEVITEDREDPAILKGSLRQMDGIVQGSSLTLLFPDRGEASTEALSYWSYLGQDGKSPDADDNTMETLFDYATAEVTVAAVGAEDITISTGTVHFTNEQSIYRFTFKVGTGSDAPNITAKYFILTSSQNQLARSFSYSGSDWSPAYGALTMAPTASGNPYWMSIRNDNTTVNDTYTFTVVGDDDALYEGSKEIPATLSGKDVLGNGKTIGASIPMSQKTFAPEATGSISVMDNVL